MHEVFDRVNKYVESIRKDSRNDIVLYTCITGSYDLSPPIKQKRESIDYILFLDEETRSSISEGWAGWKIFTLNSTEISQFKSGRFVNRFFKVDPTSIFKNYAVSIYTDSNNLIKDEYFDIVNDFKSSESEFLLLNHRKRDCLYDEIKECIFWRKDWKEMLKYQRYYYHNELQINRKSGLYDGSLFARKNTSSMQMVMRKWWDHLIFFSSRDQISLAALVAKSSINVYVENNNGRYYDKVEHNLDFKMYSTNGLVLIRNRFIRWIIGLIR